MATIVAPEGSPLSVAVVGCESLAASKRFYVDDLGFDVAAEQQWDGPQFERLWALPAGSTARAALLSACGSDVGRVLLVEFDAARRERVREGLPARAYGLFNLNFYTVDAVADAARFRARGFEFWSEPVRYDLGASAGSPVEVIFEGPDTVAINLVELATTDPATRIGQMRAYVEQHGRTRTGFTPVVTTSHVARSIPKARDFYERVLGMGVLIDEVIHADGSNRFLRLEPGSRTHVVFMQGNHMFGKVALSQPLNYPCEDLAPRAHAPNIGYLAQAFEVKNVAKSLAAARSLEARILLEPREVALPGLGARLMFAVANPGSGAVQWVLAR
jgi:catechol 2,3-dioxygenase-like lactoylglutathione lyase family enzyme